MNHRERARRKYPQSGFERFLNVKNIDINGEEDFANFLTLRTTLPIYILVGSELETFYRAWRKELRCAPDESTHYKSLP